MSGISDSPPPSRDVKFIPETTTPIPNSVDSADSSQEHLHSSKKPRNYKYWSDDEVKKILRWLTLPENDGKLARNKAQTCREVAKKLFDGDEYMAISVRSKLMSLEKSYKEAEQLRLQLNTCTKDESLINEKVKEISKFHKECRQLFGNSRSDLLFPPISTSPITANSLIPYSPTNSSNSNNNRFHSNNQQVQTHHSLQPRHQHSFSSSSPPPTSLQQQQPQNIIPSQLDSESPSAYDSNNGNNSALLPQLNEDRLRALSIPPHMLRRGSWSLPRVPPVDLPPVEVNLNDVGKKRKSSQDSGSLSSSSNNNQVLIAKYAAQQASYAAKQAEYEALRSEHEQQKMGYAIRLAEIELDRDALSIKKLELEVELAKARDDKPKNVYRAE